MEKAIFSNDTSLLKRNLGEYSRVYCGNEFCEQRIPSNAELERIYSFCEENGLGFTLVTPFVSEAGISRLEEIFSFLGEKTSDIELVFNDWGVYSLAAGKFRFCQLILGRLLNRQKRDPQILNVIARKGSCTLGTEIKEPDDEMLSHFRMSISNVPESKLFFERRHICRVELDNLVQGIHPGFSSVKCSLYYPWGYISLRRWCEENHFPLPCKHKCRDKVYLLENKSFMPRTLYRKGNAIFFKEDKLPESISYIDRLVHIPELII